MDEMEIDNFLAGLRSKVDKIIQEMYEEKEKNLKDTLSNADCMVGDIIEITSCYSCLGQPVIRQVLVVDTYSDNKGTTLLQYIDLDPSITSLESSKNITEIKNLGHIDQIEEIRRLIINH